MARQSDGRYRAKVTVGKDMNGGSVVKYVSGRTKKELEAAKAKLAGEQPEDEAEPEAKPETEPETETAAEEEDFADNETPEAPEENS